MVREVSSLPTLPPGWGPGEDRHLPLLATYLSPGPWHPTGGGEIVVLDKPSSGPVEFSETH